MKKIASRVTGSVLLAGALQGAWTAPAAAQFLPTREQIQPPVPDVATPSSEVRIDGNKAFRETPCPFDGSEGRIEIRQVYYEGTDGAPVSPELYRAVATLRPGAGEQSIAQICDLRDEANRRLRGAGYVASVQIPPQEIIDGSLRLTVITARVVKIDVQNASGRYGKLIAARAEKLKALRPFNQQDAERILLLAGDVPGLDVQLSLSPAGSAPGDVIGTLTVDYKPYSLVASASNMNSRSVGRETLFYRAEIYGLTGLADVTYAGISTTLDNDEQQVFQVGHSFSPDSSGTRIEGGLSYAISRPDIGGLDIRSQSYVGSLSITSPILRTSRQNANLTAGFDFIGQKTRFYAGTTVLPLTQDDLRIAYVRASGSYVQPSDQGYGFALSGGIELRRGLDILGAMDRYRVTGEGAFPSRVQGDPQATVARFDLDGQFSLGPIFTLSGSLRAQRASDPLMNYEQFSVGSLTVGRGYDPGAVSGDSAIAVRNELRGMLYRGSYIGAELYGFYDYAWLWNYPYERPLDGSLVRDPNDDRLVRSIGFGTRLTLPGNLFLDALYAHPLDGTIEGGPRPTDRFLVSLTAQYSPTR